MAGERYLRGTQRAVGLDRYPLWAIPTLSHPSTRDAVPARQRHRAARETIVTSPIEARRNI